MTLKKVTISILEASDTGLLDDDQYTGGFRHWITG